MTTNKLKTSNTIADIADRLQDDTSFRNLVEKIGRLSESQLERADKLIDLFFVEPLKDDK